MPKISSGCNTCRRRKKGCDFQRPSCGQCLEIGIPCAGYSRRAKFIHVTQADVSQATKSNRPIADVCNGSRAADMNDTHEELTTLPAILNRQPKIPDTCCIPSWNILFESSDQSSALSKYSPFTGWMFAPQVLNPSDRTLQNAMTALSLSALGRSSSAARLVDESRHCYSLALKYLQRTIAEDTGSINDESLAGMMFLSLYEVVEGSPMRGLGWISHTDAATHLIKRYGCASNCSDFRKKLFLGLRLFSIIRAISCRRPTFLATSDWTFFRSIEEPGIMNYNRLLSLMARVPSILGDIDSIKGCDLDDMPRINNVSTKCCALVNELRLWHASFQAGHGGVTHWDAPSKLSIYGLEGFSDFQKILFSTCIYFPHSDIANLEILYWTAQLLISNNLWLAYKSLETQGLQLPCDTSQPIGGTSQDNNEATGGQAPFQLPPLPLNMSETYVFSTNIARSLEFFLSPRPGAVAVTRIAFPVTVAMGFFQHFNLPELAWFRMIFDYIKHTSGIDLEEFLDAVADESASVLVG